MSEKLKSIRIIGCGAMGSAFAEKFYEQGHQLFLYDKDFKRASDLAKKLQVHLCKTPLDHSTPDEICLLAVKPQDFFSAVETLKTFSGRLMVSIVTGISQAQLTSSFSSPTLRMMPNLAIQYGAGVLALAENPSLEPLKEKITALFSPFGLCKWLPESSFDAITALTGSGPAFVFSLIEAMVDAAISMGLSSEVGQELVIKMIEGSLITLTASQASPSSLKWQVTSPGGTTIAGLRAFEKEHVRSGIIETFLAAFQRAKELSKIK